MAWETTISAACFGEGGKVGLCLPVVSDTEDNECCIVHHTRLVRSTDLPFYCTSTSRIQLTAEHYISTALTIYPYAVAPSGGLMAEVVWSWQYV